MGPWLTYVKERFPLPVYLLLTGGIAFSSSIVTHGSVQWLAGAVAMAGLLLFFFQLRLMDELKDFEKDKIAHPGRPLPRGLLTTAQVRRWIGGLLFAMLGIAVLYGTMLGVEAGAAYAVVTAYLYLMYREFFVGRWLVERPLVYAVSHQIIMLPVVAFAAACVEPSAVMDGRVLYLSLANLGAFFAYEVCRKLDPKAHPVLKTYLQMYGTAGTFALVIAASAVAFGGAWALGLEKLLWPFAGLLVVSFVALFGAPGRYKLVEGVASLSLLVHLWGPVIGKLPWVSGA